ncbi:hypothetical protein FTX61_00840 [Nitriliruptoraceae bacterium ZYF776]|nr:hypothetical protein [Profundirhabdus halotolerans]
MRRTLTLAAAGAAMLALPTAASAQSATTFTANLSQANDSGASGSATVTLDGTTATVRISGSGFFDGFPHAMHIHGEPGGDAVCGNLNLSEGSELDADGDGVISVTEAAGGYGPIAVSLTTEGDTSPDSGLAVDRFPTSGSLDYERTFELPADVAEDLSDFHIVVHALDLDDSGEIGDSGIESDLDPSLDMEATAPAACGQLVASAAGGVDTGAGGTATNGAGGAAAAALFGAAALGAVAIRRRRVEA